jgi:heptaprenyl diphosphate synthase
MDAGGKRLRPLLALLAAQFGPDGVNQQVVEAAVAVELIHLATLYHDDVMDRAPLRRGAPAAHEVWGNHVAILTGDLLFARSALLMSGLGPAAVRIQAETFERLVLGQLHETVGAPPDADPVFFYLGVLADKTASLTAAATRLGAMFANAPVAVQNALAEYGEALGVAFQLADDVIDFTGADQATAEQAGEALQRLCPLAQPAGGQACARQLSRSRRI